MFKTFILGLLLGLFATAGLVYIAPVVDLERERSITVVNTNGGTQESLHANLPGDRIAATVGSGSETWPEGMYWPPDLDVGDAQVELFKLRDAEDQVVGVASRLVTRSPDPKVEWTVHMPARGTMYALVSGYPDETGTRSGRLRAGSREFAVRTGTVTERFEDSAEGLDGDGRLTLTTILVSTDFDEDTVAEVSP